MEVLNLKAFLGPGFPLSCIHTAYIGINSLPEILACTTTPRENALKLRAKLELQM